MLAVFVFSTHARVTGVPSVSTSSSGLHPESYRGAFDSPACKRRDTAASICLDALMP
jgi:hypothetical protein